MRTINRVLDALQEHGPLSVRQLSEALQLSYESIRAAIVDHRMDPWASEKRRLRVCDFEKSMSFHRMPRKRAKIYGLGNGPDAVCEPWDPRTIVDRRCDEWSARVAVTDEAFQSLRPLIESMQGNPFAVSIAQGRLV